MYYMAENNANKNLTEVSLTIKPLYLIKFVIFFIKFNPAIILFY